MDIGTSLACRLLIIRLQQQRAEQHPPGSQLYRLPAAESKLGRLLGAGLLLPGISMLSVSLATLV